MTLDADHLRTLHEAATAPDLTWERLDASRDLTAYLRNAVPDILELAAEVETLRTERDLLIEHYRADIRYAERVYGPQEWRGLAADGALAAFDALVARDADEEGGT